MHGRALACNAALKTALHGLQRASALCKAVPSTCTPPHPPPAAVRHNSHARYWLSRQCQSLRCAARSHSKRAPPHLKQAAAENNFKVFSHLCPCSYGGAGALWKIFARADVDAFRAWLWDHIREFQHHNTPLDPATVLDPIHDQVSCAAGKTAETPAHGYQCVCTSGGERLACGSVHFPALALAGCSASLLPRLQRASRPARYRFPVSTLSLA